MLARNAFLTAFTLLTLSAPCIAALEEVVTKKARPHSSAQPAAEVIEADSRPNILSLPMEMRHHILSFLNTPEDLLAYALTCKGLLADFQDTGAVKNLSLTEEHKVLRGIFLNSTKHLRYLRAIGTKAWIPFLERQHSLLKTLKVLSLEGSQLKLPVVKKIATVLETSNILEVLDLRDNSIKDRSLKAIAKALGKNKSLKKLIIVEEAELITHDGFTAMAKALHTNTSLKELRLTCGDISDESGKAIGESIRFNNSLTFLDLSYNSLTPECGKAIQESLKVNVSLKELVLKGNLLGNEGTKAIAEAVKTNNSLEAVSLEDNEIEDEGAIAIGEAIQVNQSLKILNLQDNFIGKHGGEAIAKALETNQSLNKLNLGINFIKDEEAIAIVDALQVNDSLKELNLSHNRLSAMTSTALQTKAIDRCITITLNSQNRVDEFDEEDAAPVTAGSEPEEQADE